MKLHVIIIDDEEGARLVLENYIARLDNAILAGVFSNALDAFKYIKQHRVDIILLDISMPEIDGFGLLDMLPHKPGIIFTTAYSDFALKGFEYNAIDYLKKPIRFERFLIAMDKAGRWGKLQNGVQLVETMTFKVNGIQVTLSISNIHYAESLGNYIKLYTDDKSYILLMTMLELEQQLPASMFIRIHKSYIINTRNLSKVIGDKAYINETALPIGKTYKKYFATYLKLMEL